MREYLDDGASPREKMRFHAVRRLWERRGIYLADAEYEAIVVGVRAGLYKQVARGEKGRTIFEVVYRDRTVYAVWEPAEAAIITFLPHRTWAERNHRGEMRSRAEATFREARA